MSEDVLTDTAGGTNWLGAASTIAGSVLKPAGAAPSSANSIFGTNLAFDNSGWNVSFGNNSGISADVKKTTDQGGATQGTNNLQSYLPYVLIFVGAAVAIKYFKK